MPVDKALLDEAISAIRLQAIGLYSSSIDVLNETRSSAYHSGISLGIKFRHYPKSLSSSVSSPDSERHDLLRFLYETEVVLLEDDTDTGGQGEGVEAAELFKVAAVFVADYLILDPDNPPSFESLEEFARCNLGHQVWPYWREYFSSCLTRCNFPSVMLPMYSLSAAQPELKQQRPGHSPDV